MTNKPPVMNPPVIKPPVKNPMMPNKPVPQQIVPQQTVPQKIEPQMTADEEFIYSAFENYQQAYCSVYTDEVKQKDFTTKLSSLFTKLQGHDLKPNLISFLCEFVKRKYFFKF
jgi:hypothetical protein